MKDDNAEVFEDTVTLSPANRSSPRVAVAVVVVPLPLRVGFK